MNWYNFERTLKGKRIFLFNGLDVQRILGVSKTSAVFLLHRYRQKGFIVSLKRNLYAFADKPVLDLYLANRLYEPSYISLEFALSYHRVIPETVYEVTSVTAKSTRKFNFSGKLFSYRRIKSEAFAGYYTQTQDEFSFSMAEPEKAFVDLAYFEVLKGKKPSSMFLNRFDEKGRFNKDKINSSKAFRYARLFNNSELLRIVKTILQ